MARKARILGYGARRNPCQDLAAFLESEDPYTQMLVMPQIIIERPR